MKKTIFIWFFISLIISGCSEQVEEEESLNCDNWEDCIAVGDDMVNELTSEYGSLVASEEFDEEDWGEEDLIADYEIRDDLLIAQSETSDQAYHEQLWKDFTSIIPVEQRKMITDFSVFSKGDLIAWVVQNDDWETWTLGINIEQPSSITEIAATNVHEFGHLLTLNAEQIDPYEEEEACGTEYTDDGCFYEDSYIYDYFLEFGDDPGTEGDEDSFVTEYAMTNMVEDIAESWAYFVLTEQPDGGTLAEEKILFFYEYDELVMLRTEILSRIAIWLEKK